MKLWAWLIFDCVTAETAETEFGAVVGGMVSVQFRSVPVPELGGACRGRGLQGLLWQRRQRDGEIPEHH